MFCGVTIVVEVQMWNPKGMMLYMPEELENVLEITVTVCWKVCRKIKWGSCYHTSMKDKYVDC